MTFCHSVSIQSCNYYSHAMIYRDWGSHKNNDVDLTPEKMRFWEYRSRTVPEGPWVSGLLLTEPPPSAERLRAHVSWHKFAASDTPGAAQEICQAMGHTCGCVTSSLLRRNTENVKLEKLSSTKASIFLKKKKVGFLLIVYLCRCLLW